MDGVHDMGGMDGFGRVEPEPIVHEESWETEPEVPPAPEAVEVPPAEVAAAATVEPVEQTVVHPPVPAAELPPLPEEGADKPTPFWRREVVLGRRTEAKKPKAQKSKEKKAKADAPAKAKTPKAEKPQKEKKVRAPKVKATRAKAPRIKAERGGKLGGADSRPVNPEQMEIARLRAELARVKMERDILGKATAYFAKVRREVAHIIVSTAPQGRA